MAPIADFGNVLRHSYFALNADIVWTIIGENLPLLHGALIGLRASLKE